MILSLVHAYCSVMLRVNQIISGVALWFMGNGLITFLFRMIGDKKQVMTFPTVDLGFLNDLSHIGKIIFCRISWCISAFYWWLFLLYYQLDTFRINQQGCGRQPACCGPCLAQCISYTLHKRFDMRRHVRPGRSLPFPGRAGSICGEHDRRKRVHSLLHCYFRKMESFQDYAGGTHVCRRRFAAVAHAGDRG